MITYFEIINHTQLARDNGHKYDIVVEHLKRYQSYLQWVHKRKLPNIYRINQDEFKKASDYLLQGLPVFIQGYQVEPLKLTTAQRKYRDFKEYKEAQVETWKELPDVFHKLRNKFKTQYPNAPESFVRRKAYDFVQDTIARKGHEYEEYRKYKYLGDLDLRNKAYRNIMYLAMKLHIRAYSPDAKTFFEVKSLIDFENSIPSDTEITDEQIAYVECNARKYGLDIPTLEYTFATRESFHNEYDEDGKFKDSKSHGFTEEIYPVIHTRDTYNESHYGVATKRTYDQVRRAMHPNNIPENAFVYSLGTTAGQYKEVYKKLKWFESLDPETRDFFIADGYCRCPHCGEITQKVNNHNIDVRCEYCNGLLEELICVSNDHLLYGTDIDNAYSDLNDVQSYIGNVQASDDTEETDYE